jgi:hypothetical protein
MDGRCCPVHLCLDLLALFFSSSYHCLVFSLSYRRSFVVAELLLHGCRLQEEAEFAISAMNGEFVGSRRVRCGWAQHKQEITDIDPDTVDKADPTNANVSSLSRIWPMVPCNADIYFTIDADPKSQVPVLCWSEEAGKGSDGMCRRGH